MARYIDADALLSRLPDDLPYKASVKRVLVQAPTADVAPRADVAREIFEEIERKLSFIRDADTDAICGIVTIKDIARLKKKYESEGVEDEK